MSATPPPGLQSNLSIAERRRLRQLEQQGTGQQAAGPKPTAELSTLVRNPANPRAELPNLEELAESIRQGGVAQALTVIPSATFAAAYPEHADIVATAPYVVINGNRRHAAAELAGASDVPIYVNTTATSRRDILVLAMVENIQRENLSPLEELETIEELKGILGTYGTVAAALGKSEGWVSQRRRLGNLSSNVLAAFKAGELTIEAARELGKIKDHAEQEAEWKKLTAPVADTTPKPVKRERTPRNKPTVPHQSRQPDLDERAEARRIACQAAVSAVPAEDSALLIAALRHSATGGAAEELASQWLSEAGGGSAPFDIADLSNPRQAVLALALARCELRMGDSASSPALNRAYVQWLVDHAAYEATAAELPPLDDSAFTA
ncbi:ParB/RepB/Spo0J family partition protein [Streptomyces sp. NRRL B-24484]|uniref:ParB/RepB/Spo0J family partition protein n=1 Tax=Streptomyces sp. NRRL B-24484 TaxID=1463833 RepID=UPI000693954F|nr:ParB/RepB/Spo0J family partition protein [Streptomyces sp. NRRL B-24484]